MYLLSIRAAHRLPLGAALFLPLLATVILAGRLSAQESDRTSAREKEQKTLAEMKEIVQRFAVAAIDDGGKESPAALVPEPLHRWTDPTRPADKDQGGDPGRRTGAALSFRREWAGEGVVCMGRRSFRPSLGADALEARVSPPASGCGWSTARTQWTAGRSNRAAGEALGPGRPCPPDPSRRRGAARLGSRRSPTGWRAPSCPSSSWSPWRPSFSAGISNGQDRRT